MPHHGRAQKYMRGLEGRMRMEYCLQGEFRDVAKETGVWIGALRSGLKMKFVARHCFLKSRSPERERKEGKEGL
jgi:hypothetical protein